MTKKIFILLILLTAINVNINYAHSENFTDLKDNCPSVLNFRLIGDVLYRLDSGGSIKLYDKVAAISSDGNTLYYIRSTEDKWIAGLFKQGSNVSFEFDIPVRYEKLYKFAGDNNIFYYLVQPLKENAGQAVESGPVLVRFNPDQMSFYSVEEVSDFILLYGKSLILKNSAISYNGLSIPLMLKGRLKISGVIDSRIVVISGPDGTEIADLIAEKSIYQYNNTSVPELPEDYNLILEFGDNITNAEADTDIENSIYYEILIDGVEENRTETGRRELIKTFYSKLDSGKYHIIKPERWFLDKIKGRYVRMNNIYQPAELKIYIPENRILKIKIEFDGTSYHVQQSVLFR